MIQSKNNLYIITEFCEGKDVAKILRKKTITDSRRNRRISTYLGYSFMLKRELKTAGIHRGLFNWLTTSDPHTI